MFCSQKIDFAKNISYKKTFSLKLLKENLHCCNSIIQSEIDPQIVKQLQTAFVDAKNLYFHLFKFKI